MGEENDGQQAGGNDNQSSSASGGDGFKAITSQADLDQIIERRLSRERSKFADYDDLKKKAAAYDEVENKNKTELQKLTEERDRLRKDFEGLTLKQLKRDIGEAKGLTPSQAQRLVGSSKEELEADADAFLADIGTPAKKAPVSPKKLKSGSSSQDESDAGLSGKERAVEALRQYRSGTN